MDCFGSTAPGMIQDPTHLINTLYYSDQAHWMKQGNQTKLVQRSLGTIETDFYKN